MWCLNSRLGYLIQCDPYQGASGAFITDIGLGGSVVTQLANKPPAGAFSVETLLTGPEGHLACKKLCHNSVPLMMSQEHCHMYIVL